MKKIYLILTSALVALAVQANITFEVGNYKYSLDTSNDWVSCIGLSAEGTEKQLTDVVLPHLVSYNGERYYLKEIAANAFANNPRIRLAYLYSPISRISAGAFKGCTSLFKVEMSAMETIASDAFEGCSSLQRISLRTYFPPKYTPNSATPTAGVTLYLPPFSGIIPRYKATAWKAFKTMETSNECFQATDYNSGAIGECIYSTTPYGKVPASASDYPIVDLIVTGYADKDGPVKMRGASYDGMKHYPRVIADSAFAGRTGLTEIVFGSVRTIGKAAFAGCTALNSVTISCDTIGASAFEGCSNLSTITLKENVNRIDTRAFAGTAITSLELPATLRDYSYVVDACNDCPNFVEYKVKSTSSDYSTNEGLLFNKDLTELIRVPVAKDPYEWFQAIPTTCTHIRSGACANNIATGNAMLPIPYGINTIGGYAFENLKGVGSIFIPSSITRIDQYAFYNASFKIVYVGASTPLNLTTDVFSGITKSFLRVPVNSRDKYASANYWKSFGIITASGCDFVSFKNKNYGNFIVKKAATESENGQVSMVYGFHTQDATHIPTTVADIRGLTYDVVSLGDSVFVDNKKITSLEIPNQITNLPRWAFQDCSSLKNVTWAEGYEPSSVGYRAFWGSGIESFNVPSTAKVIQKEAFDNCPQLKRLVFERTTSTTAYTNAYGVTNPNADLKVYISWRQAKAWCDTISKWTSTPMKYLNAYVSFADFGVQDFSCYIPLKLPKGQGLKAVNAKIIDNGAEKNYQIKGNTLYVNGESLDAVNPGNGYLLYGNTNTRYYMDRDDNAPNYFNGIIRPNFVSAYSPDDGSNYRYYILPVGSDGDFYHATSKIRGGGAYLELYNPSGKFNNIEYVKIVDDLVTGIKGDVNGDEKVDVEDVNAAINIILELKPASYYPVNADVNGDNKIDIEDVNAIINIILTN
ncbi:MAG: leucine-rich repeat protein [Muribaculaceae bacterium]|nr:leucine-rich repeat protein [Muribaculaceae bacterium]